MRHRMIKFKYFYIFPMYDFDGWKRTGVTNNVLSAAMKTAQHSLSTSGYRECSPKSLATPIRLEEPESLVNRRRVA